MAAVLGAAALGSSALGSGVAFADSREPLGVVELFTSQGCSSCPNADKTLESLAGDPDLIALTFSVDYWDYLGWKDTFARPEFTKRQRAYAAAQGANGVYTPQAVINGRADVIGSNGVKIRATLAALRKGGSGLSVRITAKVDGDRVIVSVPEGKAPARGHAAVWIASFRLPETVEIGKGENAGRKVTYFNVVERWQVLGMWNGEPMTVELPLSDMVQDRTAGLAVILQSKVNGKPGPMLGATRIDLSSH